MSAVLAAFLSLTTAKVTMAGDLLRGGAPAGSRAPTTNRNGVTPAEISQARAKAADTLARTTQVVQAMQKMQLDARGSAGGRDNLGLDPNHPGLQLPNVPNGLTAGGLQVAPGVGTDPALWQGANLPRQVTNGSNVEVTIKQTASQAVLNWQTFNVGRNTTLAFDQSSGGAQKGEWVAYNKIQDPSGVPSQILGKIQGDGQVYVVNGNGIIFGGSSQVNLHALVASTLPINDSLIARGLLNNPDGQFLFSAIAMPAGSKGPTPAFTPPTPLTPDGRVGDVVVQKGAQLSSPTTPEHVGGRVALIGANVDNEGTISTPDGQTILAAGLQVGFAAHDSSDATLRGLDTFVGAVTYPGGENLPSAGTAKNGGYIDAPRADVAMVGRSVQQLSVITSSTSTSLNGRIDLLADYGTTANANFDPTQTGSGPLFFVGSSGTVEIGSASLTRILPEYSSDEQVAGTQLPLSSQVKIEGQAVHFAANSTLLAPSANVTVNAGRWITFGTRNFLAYTGGQIYFDPGATINVAGSVDISAPLTENILTLQLRGAELANTALQRNSALRGPSITVDLRQSGIFNNQAWIGTPVGDVSGYVGLIQRTAGELTTAGGTVSLNAGESVVMQSGSKIDVSGGWINYQGGIVQTTRVMSGGHLIDISQATPDRVYDGIYTGTSTFSDAKYGISETYNQPLALTGTHYEAAYVQGANAGTVSITAPSMALDGSLVGHAIQGPRQTSATAASFAQPGTLNLTFRNQTANAPSFLFASPTPPNIVFQASSTLPTVAAFSVAADGTPLALPTIRKTDVILSPDLLTENGFGTLKIDNSDGSITVPATVTLAAPLRGTISLSAAKMNIAGKVTALGGSLSFSVFDLSPYTLAVLQADPASASSPLPDATRGIFNLGSSAVLDAAGLIADNRPSAATAFTTPPVIDGGSITINSYSANLAPGSVIDVSGGVSISATGKRTYGEGGSITINAGRDPNLASLYGGGLSLGSTLKGFGGNKGGSLTIQAPLIQIGGTLPAISATQTQPGQGYVLDGTEVRLDELLYLSPDFFDRGGFTSFTMNGIGKAAAEGVDQFLPAITIAPGTLIQPIAENTLAVPGADGHSVALQPLLKPEGLRTPVSLSFGASGTKDVFLQNQVVLRGDIVMGTGSAIRTDPLASVTFKADTVAILGAVLAPGGSITVTGANLFPTTNPAGQTLPLPTVDLGPHSTLSVAGTVLLTPDVYGRRIGSVLPGGTLSVSGNIVAEAGALLDVSGTHGMLDVAPASLAENIPLTESNVANRFVTLNSGLNVPLYSIHTVSVRVDSDAGSIVLQGGQELFTDATLRGAAGGPTAKGGSLAVSSSRFSFFDPNNTLPTTPLDTNLLVTQSGATLPAGFYPAGETAIGHLVPALLGDSALGQGHFAITSFSTGGFDALTLGAGRGAVQFVGPVSINARRSIAVGDGGVISADSRVTLQAPYIALGTGFQSPLQSVDANQTADLGFPLGGHFSPTYGAGSLTVRASLIDVGNLSLQNIGEVNLIANGGDIRGDGTLDVSGKISLRAAQVYPATAVSFTIAAYDKNIVVASSTAGSPQVTLASATLPPGFGVGSSLLGSTVQSINGVNVTLASGASTSISSAPTATSFAPGSGTVTISASGSNALPYSAGGTLNIYGSVIEQGGTLRAPLGTINIGWDGTGASPKDYLTGAGIDTGNALPVTQQLTMASGSITSVSAVDPRTGQALVLPYGLNLNGTSWVDPTGTDITTGGVATKAVHLGALNLNDQVGSLIDLQGGGDLYAYRWVSGNGGTNDLLGSASLPWNASTNYTGGQLVSYKGSTWSARQANTGSAPSISQNWTLIPQSFAVIPGYSADYSPYAVFNNRAAAGNLASGDPGYVSSGLSVGDKIYLGATSSLPAGTYTLLPARYALLPGAVLVTPQTSATLGSFLLPDGSSTAAGYRVNDLNAQQLTPVQATRFQVESGAVLRTNAQYDDYSANQFLKDNAVAIGATVPRLPIDSGSVVFSGINSLQLEGSIAGKAPTGAHGANVDINTFADIVISGAGGTVPAGAVVLDAAVLNSFGAESLLIGGIRQISFAGMTVAVNASNIEVDNAGTPLVGSEILLVAKNDLTLAPGAEIVQSGSTHTNYSDPVVPILIGNASSPGSGNGMILRVSDTPVPIVRSGITSLSTQAATAHPAEMTIGAKAIISGTAVTLDSTYGTSLDPTAVVTATTLALNSGQITLELTNPGVVAPTVGLVLSGPALQTLKGVQSLSLLSYSSIDFYGTGTFSTNNALALHAGEIRGFNNAGGTVTISAPEIILDNSGGGIGLGSIVPANGRLVFDTGFVQLGAGAVSIDQFANVSFNAAGGVTMTGNGSLTTQGALAIDASVITAAKAVNYSITAKGALDLASSAGLSGGGVSGGLGATVSLTGTSLTVNTRIALPSGSLTLHATTGDLLVGNLGGAVLDASGTGQMFHDLSAYTDGGSIKLVSDSGDINVAAGATLNVSAQTGGGNAGNVSISTPNGTVTLAGTMLGKGGAGGANGGFALDAASLPGGSVGALGATLATGGFTNTVSIRDRNDSIVLVNGLMTARNFSLSADHGSLNVTSSGVIDASGITGGTINLTASGSLVLQAGSLLTVEAQTFSDAGKGGAISLEAGAEVSGSFSNQALGTGPQLDIQNGSTIVLSVDSVLGATDTETAANTAAAALLGHFTGTLHLRAPQTAGNTDLQIQAIGGKITGASYIAAEGYQVFDLTATGGTITNSGTVQAAGGVINSSSVNVQGSVFANGTLFAGNTAAIQTRLLGAGNPLASPLIIEPGAEIINRTAPINSTTGNLTLGTSASTNTSDWNLSTYRFGPQGVAGVLTLRAAGNLVFYNALSDGFTSSANTATLNPQNPLLPLNAQSWSYRLTAGADFSAADFHQVAPLSGLSSDSGSLKLGRLVSNPPNATNGNPTAGAGGASAVTGTALTNRYQVIRTGSGDIDISAGRDVQLLNQFATIYTAGTIVDPTLGGTIAFVAPPQITISTASEGALGALSQTTTYVAQYSFGGGNVTINAQGDITHLMQNSAGQLVADSEHQIPNNWLYRRGYVNPSTGAFGTTFASDIASTTWWVDFSNFFEGIGALGGGNVTLTAGHNVSNVDAVVPTNAFMTYQTATGDTLAKDQTLYEIGGGDLTVRAGNNVDAGIYYVENGHGVLSAGNSITTNSTRSPSLGSLANPTSTLASSAQWLPTTLFLGKGSYDVSAGGDLLLGPVVNPFLLPGGLNNTFWRKSYFSTYAATDAVNVTSLGGSVTLRENSNVSGSKDVLPILQNWMAAVNVLTTNGQTPAYLQPWLRLDETSVAPFTTGFSLLPPTLRVTAFSGDINPVGKLTLSPSPVGTVEFAAAGSINGIQITGSSFVDGSNKNVWTSTVINLSDADPSAIPGIYSPYAYQVRVGTTLASARSTAANFLSFLDQLFQETGSTTGSAAVIQTKQALHGSTLLHADDSQPLQIYAGSGDISGVTLYSGKTAQIVAGGDITDIALYIQNDAAADVSVVSAGGDIIAYDANTSSRLTIATQKSTNVLANGQSILAGDIQISGPGTLQVLAGRNLDLGTGAGNTDGTGVGITSIGNGRNPNLPFTGANIVVGAGVGEAADGLANTSYDFDSFFAKYLTGANGNKNYTSELQAYFGDDLKLSSSTIEGLPKQLQAELALQLFYLILRDTGRDHNDPASPAFGSYADGFSAIAALFANNAGKGNINTRSRDIRTKSGGNINIFAPSGGLTLATSTIGTPLAPPGIVTEAGGSISIFTHDDVSIGISRIFTLRGGSEIIWSSAGNIAAGSSPKTVQSAPPTRVVIDPQSADVKLDLAGLATGGGIGVLATVGGVPPGDVDLIAPTGVVDAGDAGIRATANLNIAAVKVLNADNIQVGGTSVGVPVTPTIAAPNISALTAGNSSTAAANAAASDLANQQQRNNEEPVEAPSIITVEVVSYGGGEGP